MITKRDGKSLACELFSAAALTIDKSREQAFVLLFNMQKCNRIRLTLLLLPVTHLQVVALTNCKYFNYFYATINFVLFFLLCNIILY